MKLSYLIILIFSISCAGSNSKMKRRNLEEYFIGTGVVRYFLPEVPEWYNFSEAGSCFRDRSLRFFNLKTLRSSFSLSYEETLQLQYMYNVEAYHLKKSASANHLPFKDEEKLFFNLTEKIQAGIRTFIPPKYSRIHLIWIDPALGSKAELKKLKTFMKSPEMDQGHPVFVSLCRSRPGLINFMAQNNWVNKNIRMIPFELFSIFSDDGVRNPHFSLNFSKIFTGKKNLHFYSSKSLPEEFKGTFGKHKF